jgi:hypothetical protein
MKLLLIILIFGFLLICAKSSNLNDLLDKLDSVIYNKQEDISLSIKTLLKDESPRKNLNNRNNMNLKNVVNREMANQTEKENIKNSDVSKESNFTHTFNKDFFDPYEMTLKLLKLKEDNRKKLEVDQLIQTEVNNIIFDHLFLTNQGQPKLNFIYDPLKKEFIIPEESNF